MSDAPAAISGDFATYRHVQGRKVLQLVIEVPAELAATVFATLGTPGAGEGIPVALARLQTAPEPTHTTPEPGPITSKTGAVTRRFSELPYSQQCALRSVEPSYEQFLWDMKGFLQTPESNIVAYVRDLCEVTSRSDIVKGTPAGDKWQALEAEYWAWQRGAR